jgi:glucosyl-dolichyl phosphate glucuronosyltransferase
MRATVIIPTRGRPVAVQGAIRSLLAVDPRKSDVEIVVVDNNSEDSLSSDLRAACAAAGDPVRYVAEPSPGSSAARHRGAREARGEVLIYIDDDVQISAGWLEAFLGTFEDGSVGIAGGPSVPLFAASIPAWLWDFLEPTPYGGWSCMWLSLLDMGSSVRDIDPVWVWSLNFAIRKQILERLGGFHPDLVPASLQRWQGDGETGLSLKAKAARVRSVYVPEALLFHVIGADRLTVEYFEKRAFFQGVCGSFTSIRSGQSPSAAPQAPKSTEPSPDAAGWAKVASEVRVRTARAYNQGWQFHQRAAATDPFLLEWIRRRDYWDADLRVEAQRRV